MDATHIRATLPWQATLTHDGKLKKNVGVSLLEMIPQSDEETRSSYNLLQGYVDIQVSFECKSFEHVWIEIHSNANEMRWFPSSSEVNPAAMQGAITTGRKAIRVLSTAELRAMRLAERPHTLELEGSSFRMPVSPSVPTPR